MFVQGSVNAVCILKYIYSDITRGLNRIVPSEYFSGLSAMNDHEINVEQESVRDFSEIGMQLKLNINETDFNISVRFGKLGKDAQELINAAIEARTYSYR